MTSIDAPFGWPRQVVRVLATSEPFFYTCYYYYDIRDHKPSATKYVNNLHNLLMYILLNYYALWYKNNLFKYIERFSYSQKLMTELM